MLGVPRAGRGQQLGGLARQLVEKRLGWVEPVAIRSGDAEVTVAGVVDRAGGRPHRVSVFGLVAPSCLIDRLKRGADRSCPRSGRIARNPRDHGGAQAVAVVLAVRCHGEGLAAGAEVASNNLAVLARAGLEWSAQQACLCGLGRELGQRRRGRGGGRRYRRRGPEVRQHQRHSYPGGERSHGDRSQLRPGGDGPPRRCRGHDPGADAGKGIGVGDDVGVDRTQDLQIEIVFELSHDTLSSMGWSAARAALSWVRTR